MSNPLSLTQQYTKTYYNRGIIYSKVGNFERALENYNKAAELDPDFADIYYHRGMAHNSLENYQMALSDLEYHLTLDPDSSQKEEVLDVVNQIKANLH